MNPLPLKKHIWYVLFVLLLYSFAIKAQDATFIIPDSLKSKSYDELFKGYEKEFQDPIKVKIYLNSYYKKAIIDNDDYKKSVALSNISYYLDDFESKAEALGLAIHYAKNVENEKNLMMIYSFAGGALLIKFII